MSDKEEVRCCRGCGRDTSGLYCQACRPRTAGQYSVNRDGERGRRRLVGAWPEQVYDCDDYGDESGPDDIYDDQER